MVTKPTGKPVGRPRKPRPPRRACAGRPTLPFRNDPDRYAVALLDAMLALEMGSERACAMGIAALQVGIEAGSRRILNERVVTNWHRKHTGQSVTRLCDARDSFIFLRKGDLYHVAARHGFSSQFHEYLEQNPRPADRGSITGRTALEAKVVHVSDVMADPEYTWGAAQQLGRYRTVLGVPLLRDGSPVGVIIVGRTVVQPFTEKQIELVTTFADQAVIAIENARLFDEVQARTRDLSESLQQSTNRHRRGAQGH
jgi:GAF domain-containing protein